MTEVMEHSQPRTRSRSSAKEMLAKVRPLLGRCGVTRLANITGLDRIGIPVAIAVRPDSHSLAVDSGKGTSIEQAMISAAMEAMERHWSETATVPTVAKALRHDAHMETDFPLIRGGRVPELGTMMDWVWTSDIVTGDAVMVPKRLVQTDYGISEESLERRMFYSTTSGLSAGATQTEAVLQGLYELIERDACNLALSQMVETGDMHTINLETVEDAGVCRLIEQIRDAGCGVQLMDCSSGIEVPVVAAWIYDLECPGLGVFRGYGAHLNGNIAAARAICEAVQARAVLLAGARDDYDHAKWRANCKVGTEGTKALADLKGTVTFWAGEGRSFSSDKAELREVQARLIEGGFHRILTFEFRVPEWCPVSVVRVLVPGLEGYWTPHVQRLRPDRRAL
jgi:ribosomal protein S12 methylthiotransferase accessory factor